MKRRFLTVFTALALMLCVFSGCESNAAFGSQLEMPEQGEEIAVMHTSMGDVYIRFFPEQAPKAVENFKTLAKSGYYDGLIFHRVINNFMVQGGDPTGTGTGGESCWGSAFEDEFDASLGNLRGSLAMANSGVNTNGSQFFINQAKPNTEAIAAERELYAQYEASMSYNSFEEYYAAKMGLDPTKMTKEVLSVYEQQGGNMHLDGPLRTEGGHTVFGQVFEGMDVVDAMAGVETDGSDKPLEDITIVSIEFINYEG